jgi:hypothetical protein
VLILLYIITSNVLLFLSINVTVCKLENAKSVTSTKKDTTELNISEIETEYNYYSQL